MKKVLMIGVLALMACTDEAATRDTLRKSGYTDIQTTGYSYWGCGDDDTYSTAFSAKNSQGVVVDGVVCCGMMGKGCTIRF